MFFFKKREKKIIETSWKIKNKTLGLIMECAKSNYPNEFGGFLRVDEKNKGIISELVLLPGTISGDSHAIFRMHMMPVDFNIVGTVHSHPSPFSNPSDADLHLFRKHGRIHIIAAQPYDNKSWQGYGFKGDRVDIEVI